MAFPSIRQAGIWLSLLSLALAGCAPRDWYRPMTGPEQTEDDWYACRRAVPPRPFSPTKTGNTASDQARQEQYQHDLDRWHRQSASACMERLGYEDLNGFHF